MHKIYRHLSHLPALPALLLCVAVAALATACSGKTEEKEQNDELAAAQARADSLALVNDQLKLTNEFNQLNQEIELSENQGITLKNDSIIQQYNEAKQRVESLIKQLNTEKASNKQNRERIKQLEAEIETLRGIVKHYLEEIKRLNEENESLRNENTGLRDANADLQSKVTDTQRSNDQLSQTVKLAKKLNITGLSMQAYNKKGKVEKKLSKATQLGVSFHVAPNNTAAPGMKTFAVRILSPEGTLLSGGGSVDYDGQSVAVSAKRNYEYDNGELSATIYWNVNTTLTPGTYTVDVFCDGYRLASSKFTLK